MSFSRSYTLFLKPPVLITLDINTYIYMLMLTYLKATFELFNEGVHRS